MVEEPNKNSNTLLWVTIAGCGLLLCLGVVALAIAGAGAFIYARTPSPLLFPTLTPAVIITPTFTPIPIQSDAPLYREDFNSKGSWSTFDDDTGRAVIANGLLTVTAGQPQLVSWARPGQEFDNFDLAVTGGLIDGPANGTYGVFFRVVDEGHYYYLQLSGEGSWSFYLYQEPNWITLTDFAYLSEIEPFGGFNTIRIVADGTHFTFYANDTYLGEADDDTYASGDIGLAVGNYDEVGATGQFDDLVVYTVK